MKVIFVVLALLLLLYALSKAWLIIPAGAVLLAIGFLVAWAIWKFT